MFVPTIMLKKVQYRIANDFRALAPQRCKKEIKYVSQTVKVKSKFGFQMKPITCFFVVNRKKREKINSRRRSE